MGATKGDPVRGSRASWRTDYLDGVAHADDWVAGASHHPALTLGVGSDAALSLAGQVLTLADVLTPAEHTAIGNDAPHHAPVTLGAGNNAALALSGQELTLTMPAIPNQYRQFTYAPDGAGSWAFVVDENGMPVFATLDTQ